MNSGVDWAVGCKVRTAAIPSAVENPFIIGKRYAGDSPGKEKTFYQAALSLREPDGINRRQVGRHVLP
jgi:hypothetical protein